MQPFFSVPIPMVSDSPELAEDVVTPGIISQEQITSLCPYPFMQQEKTKAQINHTSRIKIAAEFVDSSHQINTFNCKYLPPHMKVISSAPPNSLMDQVITETQNNQTSRIKIAPDFVDSSHQINKCSSADVCSDAYVCICMRKTCDEIQPHMQVRSSTFSSTHSIKTAAQLVDSNHQIHTFSCKYLPPHMKVSSETRQKPLIDQVITKTENKTQINHTSRIKIAEFVDSSHQINTFSCKYLPPHIQISSCTPPKPLMDQVNSEAQINHSSKIKIAADFVDSSYQINTFSSTYLPPHMKVSS